MADLVELPVLHGEGVTLRPATKADVAGLTEILADPDATSWWGRYDAARVRAEVAGTWAIEIAGALAGWLHAHEEPDPDFPSVAFDIVLGAPARSRGHGREALRTAIRWFARERGHHRFTIDPAVENERAIRAYEAVGFRRVGVMRRYERGPDGRWRDGLLMDLLSEELVE